MLVSIHAPARGATVQFCEIPFLLGFNPRTREGCDFEQSFSCYLAALVSIHAPARGATPVFFYILFYGKVSIHAPARGATKTPDVSFDKLKVSIHAPARGATPNGVIPPAPWEFQSTHPRGVRLNIGSSTGLICSFNPRTREGCDLLV